jgi:hypothetical protein
VYLGSERERRASIRHALLQHLQLQLLLLLLAQAVHDLDEHIARNPHVVGLAVNRQPYV